uniref:NOC3-like protein n=3 Tax=Lygus hesperus TaxID=30085 RepID=A0A0A9XF28_LYGHE
MGKTKASRVKKTNKQMTKLRRQGKLKHKRNKKIVVKQKPPQPVVDEDESEVESDHGQGMLAMVDKEDLDFLKKAVVEGSYSMFKDRSFKRDRKLIKQQMEADEENLENEYEEDDDDGGPRKKTKMLLPIKTKSGLVKRTMEVEVKSDESEGEAEAKTGRKKKNNKKEEAEVDEDESSSDDDYNVEKVEGDLSRPVSMAEMLALREQNINQYKYKIGLLSSALLEDPHNKVMNIARLLEIFDEWSPELQVTLKKLVTVSLLEVFKDILPGYQIKHQDEPNVKLKKETRDLQNFEKSLLKGYRGYLTRMEKLASRLYKKKGDTRTRTAKDISLGELAVKSFCELLIAHPYFNYSNNIVRLVVPYLDNPNQTVRTCVAECFKHIFTHDKRGEIILEIVRKINELVKTRKHTVRPDVVAVLSHLKIKDVNLDQLKEAEIKEKKLQDKKSRIINLSKKEKKRQKRIAEVEKELLETKAEENKQTRLTLLTETTKMVFTVYFRILKSAPTSGLLSETLQGLAKFAHCINLEFYHDLVIVLNRLMATGELKTKEQLNCVLTVFNILSGQGEALNIDPNKFYAHLYANMANVTIGKQSICSELLLDCLNVVVLGRRKKLTTSRLLAFVKRLGMMSLCQEHHVALGFLTLIKQLLQLNRAADALLDVDSSVGEGVYLPELPDPEYCNASSTALYETALLHRHYHPTVRVLVDNIVNGVPATGRFSVDPEIAKLSPIEITRTFDPSEVVFKPSIPAPKHKDKPTIKSTELSNKAFKQLCDDVLAANFKADFSALIDDKKNVLQDLIKEEPASEVNGHLPNGS